MSDQPHVRTAEERDGLTTLEKHKAEFADRGGQIQEIPYGAVTIDPLKGRKIPISLKGSRPPHTIIPPKKEGWHQK